jgi:serine/threonine protein phosphatase PrpC
MTNGFSVAARSLTGLVRAGNEDSAFVNSHLLAVADGMGGHAGGEVASSVAIKVIGQLAPIIASLQIDVDSVEDLLLNSLDSVNEEISRVTRENTDLTGMGTTLTVLALYRANGSHQVAMLHVGDSRCYRLRGNTLLQMSHDHTVLQELLDQGTLTPNEASEHPQKSFLTQALMGDAEIAPVLTVFDLKPKDRFILCSDGLYGFVSDKVIKEGAKMPDKNVALAFLIDAALATGAPDNVTVVIADIVPEEIAQSATYLGAAAHE